MAKTGAEFNLHEALAREVATIPGVTAARVELGEVVAFTERDALLAVMQTLRDDPRFACEQVMDICGVDWPDRGVYHTMINTTIGNRAVADTILDLVKIVNASVAA